MHEARSMKHEAKLKIKLLNFEHLSACVSARYYYYTQKYKFIITHDDINVFLSQSPMNGNNIQWSVAISTTLVESSGEHFSKMWYCGGRNNSTS